MTLHPTNAGTQTPQQFANALAAMGYQRHPNGSTWMSAGLAAKPAPKAPKMGKAEQAKWNQFGDIQSMGKSIPKGWFGSILLSKWMEAGLVRTVRFWEDSVELSGGVVREWNSGEIIATEKGLELL